MLKDIHPLLVLSPRPFNAQTGIVIGLPMTTAMYNDTNPFAIKWVGDKKTSYILTHQPKSFDWRMQDAKPHPIKKLPKDILAQAYESLKQIIEC